MTRRYVVGNEFKAVLKNITTYVRVLALNFLQIFNPFLNRPLRAVSQSLAIGGALVVSVVFIGLDWLSKVEVDPLQFAGRGRYDYGGRDVPASKQPALHGMGSVSYIFVERKNSNVYRREVIEYFKHVLGANRHDWYDGAVVLNRHTRKARPI